MICQGQPTRLLIAGSRDSRLIRTMKGEHMNSQGSILHGRTQLSAFAVIFALASLVAALCVALASPCSAQASEDGIVYHYKKVEGGVEITSTDIPRAEGIWTIPATVDGYDVLGFQTGGWAGENAFSGIDLTQAKKIKKIHLSCDMDWKTIAASNLPELTTFTCTDAYTSLIDLAGCPKLKTAACSGGKLRRIDITGCGKLSKLNLDGSSVKTITGMTDCVSLREVIISDGRITSLDVNKCPKLTLLDCFFCKLEKLNVSKNRELTKLEVLGNKLIKLDITKNTKLKYLGCQKNKLTKLNVSKNKKLVTIDCSHNKFTKLSLANNPSLECLLCAGTGVKTLNLQKNKKLRFVASSKGTAVVGYRGTLEYWPTYL